MGLKIQHLCPGGPGLAGSGWGPRKLDVKLTSLVSHVLASERYILLSFECKMCFPIWEALKVIGGVISRAAWSFPETC